MIEFDATIVVQMINFAIFLFIMRKILFGPLVGHIQERRNYLANTEKRISESMIKLEEAEKNYHSQLNDARQRAQDIIKGQISSAEEEKQKIVQAAIEETKKVFEDFRNELGEESSKVRSQLQEDINSLAEEITGKVLAVNTPDERVLVQGGNH
jgi:F-type H+-transporting ATPase subunit b